MARSTTKELTSGSPMKLILGFAVPLLFGMLFQQFYSLMDTIIVGRYLGVTALAAVGATGSINFLIIGFCQGICNGFGLPVAQRFGARDYDGVRKYVGNSAILSVLIGGVLTALTVIFCRQILVLMQTPSDIIDLSYNYIVVIFAGIPATILYNILSSYLRSLGDSITPVIFLIVAAVLNIGLDLFFIICLHWEVFGAAFATVLSQAVSGVLCLFVIIRKFDILHLKRSDWVLDASYVRNLLIMGLPMGLQYSITAIGSILLQSAVNSLGETYMAAVTAGSKVTQFLCCPFDAMGSTMATYCGQNVGAGRVDRIESGVKKCSILGIAYAIIALIVIIPFGGEFSKLFIDGTQTEILDLAKQFLWLNVVFYIPLAFVNIIRFSIQGLGNSQLAVFAGVFEMIARGGVALGLVPAFGYVAVCLASPAAWVLADLFLFPAFFHSVKILKRRFPVKNTAVSDTED